jgi:hypothetical protein
MTYHYDIAVFMKPRWRIQVEKGGGGRAEEKRI